MYPFLGGMMRAGAAGPVTVWNQSDTAGYGSTFSADGAKVTSAIVDGGGERVRGRNPRSTGKYYFEINAAVAFGSQFCHFGLAKAAANIVANGYDGGDANAVVVRVNSERNAAIYYKGTGYGGLGPTTTATSVLRIAVDLTNGLLWAGQAGTWYGGDPVAGTGGVPIDTGVNWLPYGYPQGGNSVTIGGSVYAPPAGFQYWI